MNGLSRVSRGALPWLLLLPAVIPLVIGSNIFYPYLSAKTYVFAALALLALASFAILAFSGEAFYVKRLSRPVAWIPGALLVLAYVASLFGIDFYRSFWGTYARGEGLLMLTLTVSSFYLILLTFNERYFNRLIGTVTAVGALVALWGVIEWFTAGGRVESSLGNAAFLAGYLSLAFFITLIAARRMRAWRSYLYALAALELLVIVLTATRGAILAFGVVALIVLGYVALQGGRRGAWAGGFLALLIIAGGLGFIFRHDIAQSSFEPLARLGQISTQDPDVASRLFIWRNMLGEIAARPLLGYGAEHIDYLFNKFYDPSKIVEEWFDRSHNAYLDYAAQYGVGGFLLYAALIISFAVLARRYARSDRVTGDLLTLAIIAYAVQNFFIFDTISTWWLLLALFACLIAFTAREERPQARTMRAPALGISAAILFILLVIPCAILPLVADYDLYEGYYNGVIDVHKSISYLNAGLSASPHADLEYGYEVYDMYANAQAAYLTGADRLAAYNEALKILTANYNRYPYDARTALYLGNVLSLAPPEEPADVSFEKQVLQRAMTLSPKRSQPWYILANLSLSTAQTLTGSARAALYNQVIGTLQSYIALVPNLSQPHFVLAELYYATGNLTQADQQAALGVATYMLDVNTAIRAAGYFEARKDYAHALSFVSSIVALEPTNLSALFDEAKLEYLTGNAAGADAIVQTLRTKNPQVLSTDPAFMAAITQYESQKR